MSKKFYIGICCLALLATSVASGYSEDFEGYTRNVGDGWDDTTEFATSGWGDLYRLMEEWGDSSRIVLRAGYNSTQGVAFPGVIMSGAARLLPSPQGPNSTFVYTAMVDFQGRDAGGAGLFFGTDELVTGPQAEHDGWFWVYLNGDSVMVQYGINTDTRDSTGWINNVFEWGRGGWVEHKIEADTNENARPTTVRYYYRDLEEDRIGPVGDGSWTQIDLGGTGGGIDLDMDGDNYQIEAIGFAGKGRVYFDNFVATVDVPLGSLVSSTSVALADAVADAVPDAVADAVADAVPDAVADAVPDAVQPSSGQLRWFKGNTHTHTWWSDGDSPPETAVKWYKEHGYHFLVLSDHNVLSQGEKWILPTGARFDAAQSYEEAYGPDWIVKRERDGLTEYRLKPLSEFRTLFEEPGEFLLIQGEEISASFEKLPIHVNGINLVDVIPPQTGASLQETMQINIDAVNAQRLETGQPMFPHLNHPNFEWACPVEAIMGLRGAKFFEVYNGHPRVNNYGERYEPMDASHLSTERMWDIILTHRLSRLNLPVMYGLATDDTHDLVQWGLKHSNAGRGWVVVRARYLTPEHIVSALEQGDFYASTGVVLRDITFEDETLTIDIQPRFGVQYTTRFIGTRVGYDAAAPGDAAAGSAATIQYSAAIGEVLSEQSGTHPRYEMTGDEIYVRAKVISTARHPRPYAADDVEVAWVQPIAGRACPVSPKETVKPSPR